MSETIEGLRTQINHLNEERTKRLKGELALAAAKKRVDDELSRMKAIQRFVGEALKISDVDAMLEAALETTVEAFECETAFYMERIGDGEALRVALAFDGEEHKDILPCPEVLLNQKESLLLQGRPDLMEHWSALGLVNGLVCTIRNKNTDVVGAVVCGNTADGEGIYVAMEDLHRSSFSVLASQIASLRENLLLDQKVQEHVLELEDHRALLEQRVAARTAELAESLDVIKQSLSYAARIQRSNLPDVGFLKTVTQDHFLLWEPRDQVGGDLYWAGAWGDGYLIILGDCTGHGVPGAFMTLITIGALQHALRDSPVGSPGKLVARLHQLIQIALGQHYDKGESDDGLELGAVYYSPERSHLVFVGARFDLYEIHDGEVVTVKGTRKGLGYRGISYTQEYTEKSIQIRDGARYYMTTDGYIDQVGGVRRRMFGKKRLMDLLLSLQHMPMAQQKDSILQALHDYQGSQTRRDDIAVIGFSLDADQSSIFKRMRDKFSLDDRFLVGYQEIDDDHRILIAHINAMNDAIQSQDGDVIRDAFEKLYTFTNWHLQHEEKMMMDTAYPESREHKVEHAALRAKLQKVSHHLDAGHDYATDLLPDFLNLWLFHHIAIIDSKLADFLSKSKG